MDSADELATHATNEENIFVPASRPEDVIAWLITALKQIVESQSRRTVA
jgi:hypothetical protein